MVTKDEFIPKYISRFENILKDKLSNEPQTLQEMVDLANKIIQELIKLY